MESESDSMQEAPKEIMQLSGSGLCPLPPCLLLERRRLSPLSPPPRSPLPHWPCRLMPHRRPHYIWLAPRPSIDDGGLRRGQISGWRLSRKTVCLTEKQQNGKGRSCRSHCDDSCSCSPLAGFLQIIYQFDKVNQLSRPPLSVVATPRRQCQDELLVLC